MAKRVDHAHNESLLGVRFQTYPAPSRKVVTLAFVLYDTLSPRGHVAVRVAASDSPSWTMQHGQPLPFDHAKYFFPDDVIDRERYSEA